MSVSKVLALSSQPCRQRTEVPFGEPQALLAMWPQGTAIFSSENRPEGASLSPGAHSEPLVWAQPLTPVILRTPVLAPEVTGRDPEVGTRR